MQNKDGEMATSVDKSNTAGQVDVSRLPEITTLGWMNDVKKLLDKINAIFFGLNTRLVMGQDQ